MQSTLVVLSASLAPAVRTPSHVRVAWIASASELEHFATQQVTFVIDPAAPPSAELRSAALRPSQAARVRDLVGSSAVFRNAVAMLERVADTDVTVLVLGETGTGKELAARLLHARSARAAEPFVAVNCAALPESLVESELFGHEAGAFTGAVKRRIGRIEQAHRGTLFLDEIGDLPVGAQAKLLRALQEREIERVGSGTPIAVDVRVIAATHRDLADDPGRFRRDLYYRLSAVTVRLPALRERLEDLPALASHFLALAMQRMNRSGIQLDSGTLAELARHAWPGNVRELENVCTRLVALSPSGATILPAQLVLDTVGAALPPAYPADLRSILAYCERAIVQQALARHAGNRTHAAAALGISRQALQKKLARP
jgi:two-component system, NtrC family, response regulator HydG